MSKAISTRISEETAEKLDNIAEDEHMDRATLLRKMLEENIEDYMKRKAAERYRKGEKSVEAAAKQAEIPVWEMIDYLQKENIQPPKQKEQELEEEYSDSKKL